MVRHPGLSAVCLLVCAVAVPASAEEVPRPQFEAGTAFLWGEADELVLRNGTYVDPMSRLTWQIPPSVAADLKVVWPWTRNLATRIELRTSWPLTAGTLVDEDWNAPTKSGTLIYGRSEHTASMTSNLLAGLEQDFVWDGFHLGLGALYRWMTWEGWNGHGQYQTASSTTTLTYSGLLIAYRQQWLIPYAAAGWSWAGNGWSVSPSFRFGGFSFCSDMDNHNYAGDSTTTFLDYPQMGWYGRGSLETEFRGGPEWSFGLRGGWELEWGAIGSTVATTSQQSSSGAVASYTSSSNASGAWFHEASLTVFVKN